MRRRKKLHVALNSAVQREFCKTKCVLHSLHTYEFIKEMLLVENIKNVKLVCLVAGFKTEITRGAYRRGIKEAKPPHLRGPQGGFSWPPPLKRQ